jgi:hypothetical protein
MEISPKDVLYRQISEISEPRVLKELASGNRKRIVEEILRRCIPEIDKLGGDAHENFGVYAESLLHYLLTNALIPSQRKISIKNTEVDIVIPDARTLATSPENALVLYFAKTANVDLISESLAKLQDIQPHLENILIVSKMHLKIPCKTYAASDASSFSGLIYDIDQFLSTKPQQKFKIFRS